MIRLILIILLSLSLLACMKPRPPAITTYALSELYQGKRLFKQGYYKRSMRRLLPLACDGSCEAQYAIGYMYYYGYGVAQDTDVGHFWIQRAANQNYFPAKQALILMSQNQDRKLHTGERYRRYD